jgi:Kdo2-lipid IVA lauroyltransferase/acyltransferase
VVRRPEARLPLRKRLIQQRDYLLLRLVMALAAPFSLRALQRLGRSLGLLCWRFLPFRRRVVLANLEAAFGHEMDARARRALAREFYAQLGTTLLEFCGYWRLTPVELAALIEVRGREHLDAALAHGRGVVLVSGHFGNWELVAAWAAGAVGEVRFLVKSQSNQRVDRLQNDLRRRAGVTVIRVDTSPREMIRTLRQGGVIGLLGDQDAGAGGLFVDFLGRPASVFRGTANLAWRQRCPVVTGFLIRLPDGRHRLEISPPLFPDPDWDEEQALAAITRWHTGRLAAAVRRHPEHYFWVHRRWKTQPPPATG